MKARLLKVFLFCFLSSVLLMLYFKAPKPYGENEIFSYSNSITGISVVGDIKSDSTSLGRSCFVQVLVKCMDQVLTLHQTIGFNENDQYNGASGVTNKVTKDLFSVLLYYKEIEEAGSRRPVFILAFGTGEGFGRLRSSMQTLTAASIIEYATTASDVDLIYITPEKSGTVSAFASIAKR